MDFAVAVILIRSLTEGVKSLFPTFFMDQLRVKTVVFAFSVLTVVGYNVDAAAIVGMTSRFPIVDVIVSTIVLAVATMAGNDVLAAIRTVATKK